MSAGKRVAAGRLRVDAARAVDKLREYQLPDPRLWVLEIVRGAVAMGATEIAVTGDADDVRVSWSGPPIDPDALTRLFDELVDPAPSADRRALRLLATGVNTALGMDPRWVDVLSVDGDGGALRARYTARLLETTGEGEAERLRALRAESVVAPPEAPATGGLVHLRRLPLWDAIPILVGYGEPRELSVVRRSCDDVAVPLTVGRTQLGRGTSHQDLLRVELGEGLDGFLALADPTAAKERAMMDVAEHGVILARYTLPLDEPAEPRAPVPLRLFVTAARMPTNASRSGVRHDEPPVRDALERARELLPTLVERLVRELGETPEHAWSATQQERLRAAALALLATACAGRGWQARLKADDALSPLPAWLVPLSELPLLRDALGRTRTPASFRADLGQERVHFGAEPVDPYLEPWLGDSLWVPPGDPAAALLGRWSPPSARELVKLAKRHTERRDRFWADEPREARLDPDPRAILKVSLRAPGISLKSLVPPERFEVEGLAGELAILDPLSGPSSELRVLIEGREIESTEPEVAIPISVVATCDALTPRYDFRAAQRDGVFERLVGAVAAGAVMACEALALRVLGEKKPGDRAELLVRTVSDVDEAFRLRVARLLRGGVALAHAVLMSDDPDVAGSHRRDSATRRLTDSDSPLLEAPIWPVATGDALLSTREVLRLAEHDGRVGFVDAPLPEGRIPKGPRPLLLAPADRELLWVLLGRAALLDLRRFVRQLPPSDPQALAISVTPALGVGLSIETDDYRVAVAWGVEHGRLSVSYWGQELRREQHGFVPPALIAVEDGRITPDDELRRIVDGPSRPYPLARWVKQLARMFADVLAGGERPDELVLHPEVPTDATAAVHALLLGIASEPPEWLGKRRIARLRKVPLVRLLGLPGLHPIAELRRANPEWIGWVPPTAQPLLGSDGFHPVVCDASLTEALSRIAGRRLENVEAELADRRRAGRRAEALRRHLSKPPADPTAGWSEPVVEVKGKGFRRAYATLSRRDGCELEVLIEGRRFGVEQRGEPPIRSVVELDDGGMGELPVRAVVDLEEGCVNVDFDALTDTGLRRARYVVAEGARSLIRELAKGDPVSLVDSPRGWALLTGWLGSLAAVPVRRRDQRICEKLRAVDAFPSVQGARVSLEAAVSGATLRVAAWDEPWLPPGPDERPSAYDDPVIALPKDEARAEQLRAAVSKLFGGQTRDVTGAIDRLQAARRVARGEAEVPRLESVKDRRFRYALDELLDQPDDAEALDDLGLGEVALSDHPMTRATLVRRRAAAVTLELNLIPRVHVIALSPLVRRRSQLDADARRRVEAAVTRVTSRVLRRVVDETPPEQLPRWVRDALRQSCLEGGEIFFTRLLDTPMFPDVRGAWITPRQVAADASRWGEIWTTPDAAPRAPYQDRLALRLTPEERQQLSEWVPAIDATQELALDEQLRENLRRPRVESLEPTPEEMDAAATILRVAPTDDDPLEGTITVLKPGFARLRGMHLSRERQPFGDAEDPARWPSVCRLDHPDLEPDRTWSAPQRGTRLQMIEGRVRSEVWRALAGLIPYPKGARFAMRVRPSGSDGVTVEGVAHLRLDGSAGAAHVFDPRGEREITPAPDVPVQAQLWFAEPATAERVSYILGSAYQQLLKRVADRLVAGTIYDREIAMMQLLRGARRGVEIPTDGLDDVEIEAFLPPRSLADVLADVGGAGRYAVCDPEDAEPADEALDMPLIVDDRGPLCDELLRLFDGRLIRWRDALGAQVLGEDEAVHPRVAAPPRAPEAEPEERRAAPRSPLAKALIARLPKVSYGGITDVVVDGRRKRPIARVEGRAQLSFAGRHPAVRAAGEAVSAGDPDADVIVRLLLARAAGELQRAGGRFGIPGHLAALSQLLA